MVSERSKGSLSGLEFRVLSREISVRLAGTYISNIYSVGESQLLRMRKPGGEEGESAERSLVLSPRLGAWITERPVRAETTEFTTSLRSHLLRARFAEASQLDLDRVLTLRFESKGEDGGLRLVLEMMPPGNLLLTDAAGTIIVVLREVRTEDRKLLKGRQYAPPTQTRASLETITKADLERALAREKTLGRALGRGLSVPRRYVDEILDRISRGQEDSTSISGAEVDRIATTVKEMLEEIAERPYPCLVRAGEGSAEVMVTRPKNRSVIEASPTLSPLLDELLFSELLTTEEEAAARSERAEGGGEPEAAARERRGREYAATISNLESKKQGLEKLSGELRRLAPAVGGAPDAEHALGVVRAAGVAPSDLLSLLGTLVEKGQASMSSAIFDRAKRTEREIEEIDEAVKGLQSKLKKESAKASTTRVKAVPLKMAKKEWFEKFRWFFTTGGKLAIGGRDAQSNATLVRRHAQQGDTVYHADLFGSPFFVLKGGKEQREEEVREVAKATVSFSSAWKTGLSAADAYWVDPEQVSSAGPSGEYLAHGSFAIKGKKNFVTKNPVEIAVGIDEDGRVVSGPEESIMRVAKGHVTLVPSKEKPSDTAKKVLHELSPYADPLAGPGVDDVLRMLPAGGGKIIRRRANLKPP